MSIRDTIKAKPWIGWTVAGALLVVAAILAYRSFLNVRPDSLERLSQDVTIRDRETGEEWPMKRAEMELILRRRSGNLDPNVGLPNPKTGKMTGFPKSEWESTVERLKAEHDAAIAAYGGHIPSGSAAKARSASSCARAISADAVGAMKSRTRAVSAIASQL